MLETDSLRKVLQGKAIIAANALSLPIKIGEEAFTVPKGVVYAEFWYRTGKTDQIELGGKGSFECTKGIVQFSIYAPEKSGEGPGTKMGDQLKNMFNRAQWAVAPDGYVSLHVMAVETLPGVRDGFFTVIVDGSFDFYHRNANPNNLLDD
jgi:hypothetical protein